MAHRHPAQGPWVSGVRLTMVEWGLSGTRQRRRDRPRRQSPEERAKGLEPIEKNANSS